MLWLKLKGNLKNVTKKRKKESPLYSREIEKYSTVLGELVSIDNLDGILLRVRQSQKEKTKTLEADYKKLNGTHISISQRIKDLEGNITKFSSETDTKECPTCETELSKERISKLLAKYSEEKNDNYARLVTLEGVMAKSEKALEKEKARNSQIDALDPEQLRRMASDLVEVTDVTACPTSHGCNQAPVPADESEGRSRWRRCRPPRRPTSCATRTASPRPAGCSSRWPVRRRSTGSPALAARLVGAGHAKVTLFTDQDTVVGGYGLPAGRRRRPGAADRRALGDRRPPGRAAQHPRRAAGRAGGRPAGGHLGAGAVLPGLAARGGVRARRRRRSPSTTPSPRDWTGDETELLEQLAASVVAELELSAARSAVGTSLRPAGRGAGGQLDRHLGARPAHRGDRLGRALRGDLRARRGLQLLDGAGCVAGTCTRTTTAAVQEAMPAGDRGSAAQFTVEFRALHASTAAVRWMVSRGRRGQRRRAASRCALLGTISTSPTPAAGRRRRLSAVHRADRDRRGGRRAGQRGPDRGAAPRSCSAAPRCSARSPARWRSSTPTAAPLRLHMTNRLIDEVRPRPTSSYPVAGVEIELDDTQPTQYAAHARPAGAARRPRRRPSPGSRRWREGLEVLGVHALAALPLRVEGRVLGTLRRRSGPPPTRSPPTTSRCWRRSPRRSR